MKPYPHNYVACATGKSRGTVETTSPGLAAFDIAPPPEFGGPTGRWSPETLLCAAIADCFILTFRALSRAAHFDWLQLECRLEGMLERVEQKSQFTRYTTLARLTLSPGANADKARELLKQAEDACLIANSLSGARVLEARVIFEGPASRPATAESLNAGL
jgi:organic hydroperoxide reductase OsmC/OhrA